MNRWTMLFSLSDCDKKREICQRKSTYAPKISRQIKKLCRLVATVDCQTAPVLYIYLYLYLDIYLCLCVCVFTASTNYSRTHIIRINLKIGKKYVFSRIIIENKFSYPKKFLASILLNSFKRINNLIL